jgi:hypothetical protein
MWKVAPPPQFLRSFLILCFPKFTPYFFKRVLGSSVDSFQFIFEIELLKELLYLRTDENAFFYLGLADARKFVP